MMRELVVMGQSWVKMSSMRNLPVDPGMSQLDRAIRWLEFNSMEGLSQRQAADYAGVSLATMQRAIKAKQ